METKKTYNGFASYLTTGEITKEFVTDFEWWARKYFRQWTLFMEWDDFYAQCWEALMEGLPSFDPKVATIQTFCISRISNECWRIYMGNKTKKAENDIDDPSVNCNIQSVETTNVDVPHDVYFNTFSEYAYNLGVKVDINKLYADYVEGNITDAVKTFSWWYMKERLNEHN